MKRNVNKSAFTLAEVLITLGIIGVVAAMTIPVLVQNHRKHVVETKLKKVYSLVNQAIKMSEAEYGDIEYWDITECANGKNCTYDEAVEKVKQDSRNYAKRQITFFSYQLPIERFTSVEDILRMVKKFQINEIIQKYEYKMMLETMKKIQVSLII